MKLFANNLFPRFADSFASFPFLDVLFAKPRMRVMRLHGYQISYVRFAGGERIYFSARAFALVHQFEWQMTQMAHIHFIVSMIGRQEIEVILLNSRVCPRLSNREKIETIVGVVLFRNGTHELATHHLKAFILISLSFYLDCVRSSCLQFSWVIDGQEYEEKKKIIQEKRWT